MPPADRHTIEAKALPANTAVWLSKYGYKCAVTAFFPGVPCAVLFQRDLDFPRIAYVGDTLRWDAYNGVVVVERG